MSRIKKKPSTRAGIEKTSSRRETVWLLFAVGLVVLLFSTWRGLYVYSSYLSTAKLDAEVKVFDVIFKIASVSALAIGAQWSYRTFFRQRLTAARLNLSHDIRCLALPDGRHLLKVYAEINNVGQVKVDLTCWKLSAEQILPLDNDGDRSERKAFTDKQLPWLSIADGEFTPGDGEKPEAFWMSLEPGEKEQASGNLIIPNGVEVVQVYSHFALAAEEGSQGWESKSLVDLRDDKLNKENQMGNPKGAGVNHVETKYTPLQQHHSAPAKPGGGGQTGGAGSGSSSGGKK